jgi:hypothetical protein
MEAVETAVPGFVDWPTPETELRPPAIDWRSRVSAARTSGPISGLCLWFPKDEFAAIGQFPFVDLELEPDLKATSGDGRRLTIRLLGAEGPVLRLASRGARHLCTALTLPLPMGEVLRPDEAVRISAELGDQKLSARSLSLVFEESTNEPLLPGPALRLATILIHPDTTTGLELLLPLADGAPDRLRARLAAVLDGHGNEVSSQDDDETDQD